MQVDNPIVEEMISLFDLSKLPWSDNVVQNIETRRAHMADTLIFDVLLTSGGVRDPDTLYPPSGEGSLRRLLEEIANSGYDTLKRDCLVYFLLKWHQDGREESFAEDHCIPPPFQALANAYWHLDTGIDITKAVTLLSDMRLNRDFSSKVLSALSLSGPDAGAFVLKYVRTAKPQLTEPDDLDLYILALADSSLRQAWQFARTFSEHGETRRRLFDKIISWCLAPPKPLALQQLIAFPLSAYEQSLLHEAALYPPTSIPQTSVPILQDLVCVRLIQSGKYTEAIKLDRQFADVSDKGPAHAAHRKSAQDRHQMMEDIIAAMPVVERSILSAELDLIAKGALDSQVASGSGVSFAKGKAKAPARDLAMSWETVSPMSTSMYASTRVAPPAPTLVNGAASTNGNALYNQAAHPAPASTDGSSSAGPLPLFGASMFGSSHLSQPARAAPGPSPLFNLTPTAPKTNALNFAPTERSSFYAAPENGMKRSADGGLKRQPAFRELEETEDVNMESDFDDVVVPRQSNGGTPRANGNTRDNTTPRANKTERRARSPEESEEEELSHSVFGSTQSQSRGEGSGRIAKPEVKRTETQTKMPPGAFEPSDDNEYEHVSAPATVVSTSSRISTRSSTAKNGSTAPSISTRSTRSRMSALKGKDLGRSLPGSLMDEDTDSEEEEDHVAPLPSKSPPKKSAAPRRGRASSIELGTPVRRSTRLSTAPSSRAASSSPEVSPNPKTRRAPVARKSSRKSVVASEVPVPPKTTATRKKRVSKV